MMLSNTVFRWLMVLFVGKFPIETEYLIWDMIMVKGSTVIFRVALTILQKMQQQILMQETPTYGSCVQVIDGCMQLTKKDLVSNLIAEPDDFELRKLREEFRVKTVQDLKDEM